MSLRWELLKPGVNEIEIWNATFARWHRFDITEVEVEQRVADLRPAGQITVRFRDHEMTLDFEDLDGGYAGLSPDAVFRFNWTDHRSTQPTNPGDTMTTDDQIKAHLEELDNLLDQFEQVLGHRQHAPDRRHIQARRDAVAWAADLARQHYKLEGRHLKVVVSDTGRSEDATSS